MTGGETASGLAASRGSERMWETVVVPLGPPRLASVKANSQLGFRPRGLARSLKPTSAGARWGQSLPCFGKLRAEGSLH